MSLICIAASWYEPRGAGPACDALRREGHEVRMLLEAEPSVALATEEWEAMPEDAPARTAAYLRLYRVKVERLLAIREADCFVLVEPAGDDANYEAGFALARDVPVVRFGRGKTGLMTFDAPVAETLDDLVNLVHIHVGKQALPRQLIEDQVIIDDPLEPPLVRTGQGEYAKDYPAP